MSDDVSITLTPRGATFSVGRGSPLQDVLFPHGVEFPCGGHGRCKGCRVRVIEGSLPITPQQEQMLTPAELRAGWRLSCQCSAESDLTLELAQWEAAILSDTAGFTFTPRDGSGVAIDIGTTTIVAQVLDLRTAEVLAVRTGLNPQARFGADVMSRITHALTPAGAEQLTHLIRRAAGELVEEALLAAGARPDDLREIVLVGNTVMHHLFCGISVEPLSHVPFESPSLGEMRFDGQDLGWPFARAGGVRFLPCIAGYVGSDILAGIVALDLEQATGISALVDLGTNGEIVVARAGRMVCCSTAAGPAFEGARIYMGMRAATGAVSAVDVHDGSLRCHILGNVPPRGICGSGLVDAAAALLDLDLIAPGGRMRDGGTWITLCPPVRLSQTDIRELQLAKGAITAGLRALLEAQGVPIDEVGTVHLAGAFGNYINMSSARRIGLLPFPLERIKPAGNTALRGAKMALFMDPPAFSALARRVEHVDLHTCPSFQEMYVEEMLFPAHPR